MLTALVYVAGGIAMASILAATAVACVILSGRVSRAEDGQDGGIEAVAEATREPPAAGNAADPVPHGSSLPRAANPPPGHRPARCSLCGWHRVYRPCCGWVLVPEICPAHQPKRTTP